MITKIFTVVLSLYGITCFSESTTDISGKWSGLFTGLDGNTYNLSYNFKISGNKLSGESVWPEGTVPIDSGTLQDSTIGFNLNFDGELIPHTGTCNKDSIVMEIVLNSAKMHFTLKRSQ
jgi:hypothetical protein